MPFGSGLAFCLKRTKQELSRIALFFRLAKKARGSGLAFCLERTKQDLTLRPLRLDPQALVTLRPLVPIADKSKMIVREGQVLPFALNAQNKT